MSHLIHAFAFDSDEVMELWARYGEAVSEPSPEVGPGHRTIMLHEFHYLGPDGLPERHRTVHVIKALVDDLRTYPYLFDTDQVEVTVERGGTASELYRREDGLWGVDILLHRPLRRGETASFEYLTKFKYVEPPAPEFRRQALRRVENMELLVQFHRRKLPARVRWASWESREGALLEGKTLLPHGRVCRRWIACGECD
ncbi:MAG: hypothetical protein M3198_16425 [Actinomycetota bacterium]|nr:hypothetical protein [Actinomycetota bacterium]